MTVYVTPQPHQSLGLKRIGDALAHYAPPGITITPDRAKADVVVLHVIGRFHHVTESAAQLTAAGQRYAIVQYALRSTRTPRALDWWPLWRDAVAVWCTYDLAQAMVDEGASAPAMRDIERVLYHSPYGADPGVFAVRDTWKPTPRLFRIGTTGFSPAVESVLDVLEAVRTLRLAPGLQDCRLFHLGPAVGTREIATCVDHVDDLTLAGYYRQCQWIAGLRRIEGFELPAVEGLFCGARPLLFDRPHFRHWYQDLADYIPEDANRDHVIQSLVSLLSQPERRVTHDEIQRAHKIFNWSLLVGGFFHRLQGY